MVITTAQHLRVLPGVFRVERAVDEAAALASSWISLVRAPEGLTVVRAVDERADGASGERWKALYSGDAAHALDLPGMLAGLIGPLADGGVPVFVASTYDADLVLVPEGRIVEALAVLRSAGHRADERAGEPGEPGEPGESGVSGR
ncbi:ACT domain-containing protein [Kitasatospora sp. NPDC093550]|uniref:ACT domain-containing protein n=1 Tax=Kitasatospora sp. NPDC093550 TaxID=3364089 RepID=UPI0037F69C60